MDETTKWGGGGGWGKLVCIVTLYHSVYLLSLALCISSVSAFFCQFQQLWHVAWKCIVKESFCKHKDFGALYNRVTRFSLFIKTPVCLVPGESRLTRWNLCCSLTLGHHVTFIMRIVCQTRAGRCHRGCRRLFNGRGALLPSVAGSGALQPCAGRLKQSIIIVGNKYRFGDSRLIWILHAATCFMLASWLFLSSSSEQGSTFLLFLLYSRKI